MSELLHWEAVPLDVHLPLFISAVSQGFSVLTLSQHGTTQSPIFTVVMIKRGKQPEQKALWAQTIVQINQAVSDETRRGFGLKFLSVTGFPGSASFSGVWEKMDVMPVVEPFLSHATTSEDAHGLSTIQGMHANARLRNLHPTCISSYGDSEHPAFAVIYNPNTGADAVLWNNDGVLDSADTFHARDKAEISVWCRPAMITQNASGQFCSLYESGDLGTFVVARGLRLPEYQLEFNTRTVIEKLIPISVQAFGKDNNSARFTAIFTAHEKLVAREWTATGPVANDSIEKKMRKAMTDSIVRDAALAITYKKKLVYARGFTMAEPGWPKVEPATRFRMASCSKTATAFAIFQLIEEGKLRLTDHVQKILQLKTPGGHPPVDSRFNDITIQMLLEHTSGLNPDEFEQLEDMEKAFRDEGQTLHLPYSAINLDSFIAAIKLKHNPTSHVPEYNNCGYFLLGRVVRHLRGTPTPIDAYQKHLFDPLKITRIHRAKDLVTEQESGEARYQSPTLAVGGSLFPGFDLLPSDYGSTFRLEVMDGDGGLTGAATDLVRLATLVANTSDSPALKRSTLVTMLENGILNHHDHGGRSGYGFDDIYKNDDGSYYVQKGGSIDDAHSIFEVNGDWGLVGLWGGDPVSAPWYPFYLEKFTPDKDTLKDGHDLFPHFGMPSL
jgi:CubicO group peptidase (beta-lactamase class C family)